MVCSRGESLTHRMIQMKLFNAIAAAAVIGSSFMAATPAEARNGWVYMGSSDGEYNYMRPLGKKGEIARIEDKWSDSSSTYIWEYNCAAWQKRMVGGTRGWTPIFPSSIAEEKAMRVC